MDKKGNQKGDGIDKKRQGELSSDRDRRGKQHNLLSSFSPFWLSFFWNA
jgi:hypothetical protein